MESSNSANRFMRDIRYKPDLTTGFQVWLSSGNAIEMSVIVDEWRRRRSSRVGMTRIGSSKLIRANCERGKAEPKVRSKLSSTIAPNAWSPFRRLPGITRDLSASLLHARCFNFSSAVVDIHAGQYPRGNRRKERRSSLVKVPSQLQNESMLLSIVRPAPSRSTSRIRRSLDGHATTNTSQRKADVRFRRRRSISCCSLCSRMESRQDGLT